MRPAVPVLLAFLLVSPLARADTTYAASSATLSNGAEIHDCAACSGGKIAGHIGGDDNGKILFSNVMVPVGGLYPMTVYFTVSDDRSFAITVNNEIIPQTVIFRHNSRRGEISDQTVLAPLAAGANTIAFDNPREFGPDLERIAVADAPIASHTISGLVQNPIGGVEVRLSGRVERRTTTDAQGRYEFNFLPDGEYRITPDKTGFVFAPHDQIVAESARNFVGRPFPPSPPDPTEFTSGRWTVRYDVANGTADILFDGKILLRNAFAEAQLPVTVTSMDYSHRKITRRRVRDNFGSGLEVDVESDNGAADKMIQTFWLYDDASYFLTRVKIVKSKGATSNFIAPLVTQTPVDLLPAGDDRALFVPFDNDKWIRYDAEPFGGNLTSYEASAFYNNTTREGLVAGSIDHDTWKTGVRSDTIAGGELNELEIFGGITSAQTRDMLPHGKITGTTIESPRIFVGWFSDWRNGLDTFAKANAAVAPPRSWTGGVPFGWNSWGKLQFNISCQKAIEASDFFARELQPHNFEDNNIVYIGLDAGWTKFSDGELKKFVDHCKANHQEAGIYFTPFTDFQRHSEAMVEGSHYQYKDIYLYAHGEKQRIAGGIALDPTHPGTKARIATAVKRFKELGFKYLKADFMVHGSLEGDHFYDSHVTTGLQAYNEGMTFLDHALGPGMYLNLAISPLFPSQYADSRRIGCDSWGDIGKVEYTLNSLSYGWWLGSVYDYNDPDHVVLGGYTDGENRARVTSAVITGLFISGDDFSQPGDPDGKERARKFLTNPDLDALGRIRKSFRPIEGDTGDRAANMFAFEDAQYFYLAAFNYSQSQTNFSVPFDRLGLKLSGPVSAKELWSGVVETISSPLNFSLPAADAVVYRIVKHHL